MIPGSLVIEVGGSRLINTLRQESLGFKLLRGVDFRESKTSGCRTIDFPNDSAATETKAATMMLDSMKGVVTGSLCLVLGPAAGSAHVGAWEDGMTAGGQAFNKSGYAGAERTFQVGVTEAEKFGPED